MSDRWLSVFLTLCTCQFALAHPDGPSKVTADMVVVNAKIWTVDKERPEAEALACWKGRIVAVGTTAEIRTLIGPKTVVIEGQGRRIVPGFHDSHCHVLGSGLRMTQVQLKDAADEKEFGRRLAEQAKSITPANWMLGGEWDHDRTFNGRLPTAADLDKHVPHIPIFIRRYDGHMALANSLAMKLAGVTADIKDLEGGEIYRDPKTKQPTGLFRDNAMSLFDRVVPSPTPQEIASAIHSALNEAVRFGVTSLTDMDGSDSGSRRMLFQIYQRMSHDGKMPCRVDLRWPLGQWDELAKLGLQTGFGNDYLRIGGLKGFMDGSLGSSTAKFFDPYVNEPSSSGIFVTPRAQMLELVRKADAAGLSVCVHAIGDQANADLLDIFIEVSKERRPGRRFRVEHAQHLRPQDYQRFAAWDIVPSMQPYHAIDDGRWAEGRIGSKRCESSYAFRSLLDAGAKLAFGSDWSVAPINPLEGIDAAVNRRTLDGKFPDGWFPSQKITVAEAIEAYTMGSAYAGLVEKDRGTVAVGKLADFVVLDRDILKPSEKDAISKTSVLMTVVGGEVRFQGKPAAN